MPNIINNHLNILKSIYHINKDDVSKQLSHMHWLTKLHQTLSEDEFIVAVAYFSVKPLSKAVTSALKMVHKQIEAYHAKPLFSGAKTVWPVQNNVAALTEIDKPNNTKRALSVSYLEDISLPFVINYVIAYC